jgi:putative endonuclease
MSRARQGREAEERAATWLAARGYRILARNVAAARGEIDIVAEREGVLCFVEVRRRGGGARVDALSSVDARKRARIASAAQAFLLRHRLNGRRARFDVVAIDGDGNVTHVENAFELG